MSSIIRSHFLDFHHKQPVKNEQLRKKQITVVTTINAPVEKVWSLWTSPEAIVNWNNASDDWHTPKAENDLRVGGRFVYRMESKDGSMGFDFGAAYDKVKTNELLAYTLDDGRKVSVTFTSSGAEITLTETFDAEGTNSVELQQSGWQAILDNFKKYAE